MSSLHLHLGLLCQLLQSDVPTNIFHVFLTSLIIITYHDSLILDLNTKMIIQKPKLLSSHKYGFYSPFTSFLLGLNFVFFPDYEDSIILKLSIPCIFSQIYVFSTPTNVHIQ